MPRVTLTKTVAPGRHPAAGVAVTETAADTVNKEQFVYTGNEILIIHNTGVGARTYTITSVAADALGGRLKDITAQSIAAGAIHVIGRLADVGWQTAVSGQQMVFLEGSHAEVKFGVVTI